jgi:hypothetical protein
MNLKEKYAYVKLLQVRYQRSTKKRKSEIIDELVNNIGYHRKHAIRILSKINLKDLRKKSMRQRARVSSYLPIIKPLKELWMASNYLCAERLQPYIPEFLSVLEQHGEIKITKEQKQMLLKVSRSTVARLLSPVRGEMFGKGKSTTRPGTLLKHQIPIQTYTPWNNQIPGFEEIDFVALCGESLRGDYVHILDVIDISVCWSELQGLMGKGRFAVTAALDVIKNRLPFPLLGIDSDNDAPFINAHFISYCQTNKLTFTRCRPYKKQDQAHIEQKNYSVVRKYFGYRRFDSFRQLKIINRICELVSLYHNFFQPVMKLKEKIRIGSRIKRIHDIPKTPYLRVLKSSDIPEETKVRLTLQYKTLNPKQLLKNIIELTDQL